MNTPLDSVTSVMAEISRLVLLPKTSENVEAFENAIGQAKAIIAEDSKTLGYLVQDDPINYAVMIAMAMWTLKG